MSVSSFVNLLKDSQSNELPITILPKDGNINGILSIFMYTFCSVSMILGNKFISTSIPPESKSNLPQISIIAFQCMSAVIFSEFARSAKIINYSSFSYNKAKQWLPVNIMFIGMLCSGFLSLIYVNVPMVTVTKNCANLLTVFGEAYIFKESTTMLTITSVILMTIAAVAAGSNDLEFNLFGYFFLGLNCFCTSAYVLLMRHASNKIKWETWEKIYYNNLLSFFILLPYCLFSGEIGRAINDPGLMTYKFLFVNLVCAFIGFYLNFASLWCVAATSATTYAIVGSLNKVPITILGFIFFDTKMTVEGIIFITLATCAGFLYAYSKLPGSK